MRNLSVGPVIPVSDLDASLEFYTGRLGLPGEPVPSGYALHCGFKDRRRGGPGPGGPGLTDGGDEDQRGETTIYLLTGTGYAGQAEWPLASFEADDLDAVVDDLNRRGVPLESIDDGPQRTNERGIAEMRNIRIAWIRDPDNQVISIFQRT